MLEMLGLGIIIEVTDLASSGLDEIAQKMANTQESAETMADSITASLNALNFDMLNASMMIRSGEGLIATGRGMLDIFSRLGSQISATSGYFENTRITLQTLYQDVEKGNEMVQWGLDYALRTPFGIEEVQDTLVGLKAIGVEADQMVTSTSGYTQELLGFIGDLGALRPDVGLQRMGYAIRNALGGQVRSLKMALDVDVDEIIGRKFGDNPAQDIADLVSGLNAEGLMTRLFGTWQQMISETMDQFTRLYMAIGDAGAFDGMKDILQMIYDFVSKIPNEDIKVMGENLSVIFSNLLTPVSKIVSGLISVGNRIKDLIIHNPEIIEFGANILIAVSGATMLSGVLLILVGSSKLLKSAMSYARLNVLEFASSLGIAVDSSTGMLSALSKLGLHFGKVAFAGWLLYKAWDMNMFNIKEITSKTTKSVGRGLKGMSYSIEEFRDRLISLVHENSFYSSLELLVMKITVLLGGIFEALPEGELSVETFYKLNNLGLLPIVENLIEIKWRWDSFVEGLEKGVKSSTELLEKLGFTVDNVRLGFEKFFDFLEGFTNIQMGEDLAEKIGVVVGFLGPLVLIGKILFKITGGLVSFGTAIGGFFTKVAPYLKPIGAVLVNIATAVGGFFGGGALLGAAIIAGVVALGTAVVKNWDLIKEKASEFKEKVKDFGPWVKRRWQEETESFKKFWKEKKESAEEQLGKIKTSVSDWKRDVVEKFAETKESIKEKSSKAVEWIKDRWKEETESFKEFWEEKKETLDIAISGMKESVVEWRDDVLEKLREIWRKFKGGVERLKTFFRRKVEELMLFFRGKKEQITTSWDGMIEGLKNAPRNFFKWIKRQFSGMLRDVKAEWNAFKQDPITYTVNTVTGRPTVKPQPVVGPREYEGQSFSNLFPGAATGGYVDAEGLVNLHAGEIVVNSSLTERLGEFLSAVQTLPNGAMTQNLATHNFITRNETENVIVEKPQPMRVEFVDTEPKTSFARMTPKIEQETITEKEERRQEIHNKTVIEEGAIVIKTENYSLQEMESLAAFIKDFIDRREEEERIRNYDLS